jgi:hypothetical protein
MVWTCPTCTLENSDGARVCDACGKTRPSAVEQPAVTLLPPPPPQQDVLHHLRSAIASADVDKARRILARLGIMLPEYTEDDPPTPPHRHRHTDTVPEGLPVTPPVTPKRVIHRHRRLLSRLACL